MTRSCCRVEAQRPDEAEFPHQVLVELVPHLEQHLVGAGARERRLVGAALQQGTEDVADRDDPHRIGNLASTQAVGISGSIQILVMVDHDVEQLLDLGLELEFLRRGGGHGGTSEVGSPLV